MYLIPLLFLSIVHSDPLSLNIDTVNQSSGYINAIGDNRLFYWHFESRNQPQTDPLIIWFSGGPGCSSLANVLFDNGPSKMTPDGTISSNPHSWNSHANVLYLDQPVPVGFSVGTNPPTTSPQAAEDVVAFMQGFLKEYPQYKDRVIHLAGESYAGRYIPVFANALISQTAFPFNLGSIIIGNGVVDPVAQVTSYAPMLCGQGGHPGVADPDTCFQMSLGLPKCVKDVRNCIQDGPWSESCASTDDSCALQLFQLQIRDPFDIRHPTRNGYPELPAVAEYFNRDNVQEALGVQHQTSWQYCSDQTLGAFWSTRDVYSETPRLVQDLLGSGVPVLAMYGDKDITCNWLSGREWTSNLEWSGKEAFGMSIDSPDSLMVGNTSKGTVANHELLTFVRVYDAGHMVSRDQPEAAAYILSRWLNGDFGLTESSAASETTAGSSVSGASVGLETREASSPSKDQSSESSMVWPSSSADRVTASSDSSSSAASDSTELENTSSGPTSGPSDSTIEAPSGADLGGSVEDPITTSNGLRDPSAGSTDTRNPRTSTDKPYPSAESPTVLTETFSEILVGPEEPSVESAVVFTDQSDVSSEPNDTSASKAGGPATGSSGGKSASGYKGEASASKGAASAQDDSSTHSKYPSDPNGPGLSKPSKPRGSSQSPKDASTHSPSGRPNDPTTEAPNDVSLPDLIAGGSKSGLEAGLSIQGPSESPTSGGASFPDSVNAVSNRGHIRVFQWWYLLG